MDLSDALKEEDRRVRRLRLLADLTLSRVYQDRNLTLLEALELVERLRDTAVTLFPGKEATFDLLYRPRFERVIAVRWPHTLPEELGDRYVLGDPTEDDA